MFLNIVDQSGFLFTDVQAKGCCCGGTEDKSTEDKSTDTTDLVETRDAGTQHTSRDVNITEYLSPLIKINHNIAAVHTKKSTFRNATISLLLLLKRGE